MREIKIVTDNRVGLAADIAEALAKQDININDLDAVEVHGKAVVTVGVPKELYAKALQTLHAANFSPVSENIEILNITDEPGALAKVMRRFKERSINVHSIRILSRTGGQALVAISVDPSDTVKELIKEYVVKSS